MRTIEPSELILNPDGSVYHLNLKPEHIAKNIIFVGDQNRVPKVAKHFDTILFETQKREFAPLETIKDNYPKFLLTTDAFTQNKFGIIHKNVFEWLLEK